MAVLTGPIVEYFDVIKGLCQGFARVAHILRRIRSFFKLLKKDSARCNSHHDIPCGGEIDISCTRLLEFCCYQVTIGFRYTLVEKVTRVTGIACNIQLGSKGFLTCGEYRNVDVGCSSGIRHRADCPESVPTKFVADCMPDTLKCRVDRVVTRIPAMPIAAVEVTLPDFDA